MTHPRHEISGGSDGCIVGPSDGPFTKWGNQLNSCIQPGCGDVDRWEAFGRSSWVGWPLFFADVWGGGWVPGLWNFRPLGALCSITCGCNTDNISNDENHKTLKTNLCVYAAVSPMVGPDEFMTHQRHEISGGSIVIESLSFYRNGCIPYQPVTIWCQSHFS